MISFPKLNKKNKMIKIIILVGDFNTIFFDFENNKKVRKIFESNVFSQYNSSND